METKNRRDKAGGFGMMNQKQVKVAIVNFLEGQLNLDIPEKRLLFEIVAQAIRVVGVGGAYVWI